MDNVELKKQIVEKYLDNKKPESLDLCRKVYEFITEGQEGAAHAGCPGIDQRHKIENGIYLVFADGHYIPFTKELQKKDAKGVESIGIMYDGHTFRIMLKDLGSHPLVRDIDNCPEESPNYKRECDGLHDWDFITATKYIMAEGSDIPLPENWYIPTLAPLDLMAHWKDDINEALELSGGEAMPDDYHWSSTENSRNLGRYVSFGGGNAYDSYKYHSYVVRPVAAWNI